MSEDSNQDEEYPECGKELGKSFSMQETVHIRKNGLQCKNCQTWIPIAHAAFDDYLRSPGQESVEIDCCDSPNFKQCLMIREEKFNGGESSSTPDIEGGITSSGRSPEGSASLQGDGTGGGEPPKPEPDAWATFTDTYGVMDDLDADEEFLVVHEDTHKKPLYAPDTIQKVIEEVWHSFTPKELPRGDLNGARKMKDKLEEVISSE